MPAWVPWRFRNSLRRRRLCRSSATARSGRCRRYPWRARCFRRHISRASTRRDIRREHTLASLGSPRGNDLQWCDSGRDTRQSETERTQQILGVYFQTFFGRQRLKLVLHLPGHEERVKKGGFGTICGRLRSGRRDGCRVGELAELSVTAAATGAGPVCFHAGLPRTIHPRKDPTAW